MDSSYWLTYFFAKTVHGYKRTGRSIWNVSSKLWRILCSNLAVQVWPVLSLFSITISCSYFFHPFRLFIFDKRLRKRIGIGNLFFFFFHYSVSNSFYLEERYAAWIFFFGNVCEECLQRKIVIRHLSTVEVHHPETIRAARRSSKMVNLHRIVVVLIVYCCWSSKSLVKYSVLWLVDKNKRGTGTFEI